MSRPGGHATARGGDALVKERPRVDAPPPPPSAARRLDVAYARTYPTLLGLARAHLADPLDAHRAAVTAMAAVWDGGRDLPDEPARQAWLCDLARRLPVAAEAEPGAAPGTDPEVADVRSALARLRRDDADLIRLVIVEGRHLADVARRLGCSEGALEVRLRRARLRLRDDLHRARELLGGNPQMVGRDDDRR